MNDLLSTSENYNEIRTLHKWMTQNLSNGKKHSVEKCAMRETQGSDSGVFLQVALLHNSAQQ
jgi:hypothetical protein